MPATTRTEDQTPLARNLSMVLKAGVEEAQQIAASLSAAERAELALYCYSRAHLHEISLAISSLCDHASLARSSNNVIAASLLAQSLEFSRIARQANGGSTRRVSLYQAVRA